MPLRNARPVTIRPLGVTDTQDGTNSVPGSMQSLSNLVPSQSTAANWVCRPAAVELAPAGGWYGTTDPTLVMPLLYNGGFVIGFMSDQTTGRDVPFVGLATSPTIFLSASITGLGVNNANCPISVSANQADEWEPPTATILVDSVVFTHPNMPNKAGRLTGVTTGIWAWETYDTAPQTLPRRATAVGQMNGRVWYACGTTLVYSDSLLPKSVTNASQALNFANGVPISALGPLALDNPIVGGVVQSMIAIQGTTAIQQITGDAATSNLATNVIKAGTGTLAPATVVPCSKGLAFVSPEGLRFINTSGQVSEPVGTQGTGIAYPFINMAVPSRMCAAVNANVLRIGCKTSAYVEYWLDLGTERWSGPHTTGAAMICSGPSAYPAVPSTFYMGTVSANGKLYRSDPTPRTSPAPTYTEFGIAMTFGATTSVLPDNELAVENAVQITLLTCAIPVGAQFSVSATDETQTSLATVSVPSAVSASSKLFQHQVKWTSPLVAKQYQFAVSGVSSADVQIGNLYAVFQPQGYTIQQTI